MTKILTIPTSMEEINKTSSLVDGFIIGIENMCVNSNFNISMDKLSVLKKIDDLDIFINLNKNMHNSDLSIIKDILIRLNDYNIKGVMYYDVAVLNIYNSLDLKYELVWSSEHLTTNYNTINYWNDFNVNYTYLSSDITEDEIINISNNSKSKLMVTLFGYLPMFVSKRHIVKNYLEYFNLEDRSKLNYIEKEEKIYPIIDNDIGTTCFSNNILNGLSTYLNIDIEYVVLNSFNIELSNFISVINMFKSVTKDNLKEYNERINSMFDNIDTGFLHKKTIYRVKKNGK